MHGPGSGASGVVPVEQVRTRRRVVAALVGGMLVLGSGVAATASTPNGLKGYEGQPGNQGGGGGGHAPGLRGYEGQPGNQGG